MAHINNFSSNLLERVDFSDSRVVYNFFLINNRVKVFVCPVPKISQVMIKWRCRASHLGRFSGTTAAELHVHNLVDLLCDTMAA